MENQLFDLKNWCEQLVIRFDLEYKWTGLAVYKDGYSTNTQTDSLNDVVEYLWQVGYDRRIRNSTWPEK